MRAGPVHDPLPAQPTALIGGPRHQHRDAIVAGIDGQLRQYCPGQTGWTCRPNDVPGTDLTFAFEQE